MDVIFEISASKLFKKGPNLIWGKKKFFFCNPVLLVGKNRCIDFTQKERFRKKHYFQYEYDHFSPAGLD